LDCSLRAKARSPELGGWAMRAHEACRCWETPSEIGMGVSCRNSGEPGRRTKLELDCSKSFDDWKRLASSLLSASVDPSAINERKLSNLSTLLCFAEPSSAVAGLAPSFRQGLIFLQLQTRELYMSRYAEWLANNPPSLDMPREEQQRFRKQIVEGSIGIGDCWVWNGARTSDGYGNIWVGYTTRIVSRLALCLDTNTPCPSLLTPATSRSVPQERAAIRHTSSGEITTRTVLRGNLETHAGTDT